MNKYLKYSLILLPPIAAVGGILWYVNDSRKRQGTPPQKEEKTPEPTPAQMQQCAFPLLKGSNNSCVKQLQEALEVKVDGIFGNKTLAALKEKAQKTQVDSAADLINTIAFIKKRSELVANTERANQFLNIFKNFSFIESLADQKWQGQLGATDAPTQYYLTVVKGARVNLQDYEPVVVLPNGKLVVYCGKGANAGWWSIDTNKIKLVK